MIRVKNALYSCVLLIGAVLALYGTNFVNVQQQRAYIEPSSAEKVALLQKEGEARRARHGSVGPLTGGYTSATVLKSVGNARRLVRI